MDGEKKLGARRLLFKFISREDEVIRKLLLMHPLDLTMYYFAVRSWRFRRLIKKALKMKVRGWAR